jgi:hypothetical protein
LLLRSGTPIIGLAEVPVRRYGQGHENGRDEEPVVVGWLKAALRRMRVDQVMAARKIRAAFRFSGSPDFP